MHVLGEIAEAAGPVGASDISDIACGGVRPSACPASSQRARRDIEIPTSIAHASRTRMRAHGAHVTSDPSITLTHAKDTTSVNH